jgi:hypothetical protein
MPLPDGFRLGVSTKTEFMPLVGFRITEGDVCADKAQWAKTPGREVYPLL